MGLAPDTNYALLLKGTDVCQSFIFKDRDTIYILKGTILGSATDWKTVMCGLY